MNGDLTYPYVALAGLLSFLSPCVLPLVPPYLCYLAGTTLDEWSDETESGINHWALAAAACFVLGFSTVFVLLGAGASVIGGFLRQNSLEIGWIAGALIVVMGLHFIGLIRIPILAREARLHVEKPAGVAGAYVMGLAFAFGWSPCIGPVLGSVFAVAGSEASVTRGMTLLAVYSAGLGIPFLIAAFAMGPFVRFLKRFRTHLGTVEKVMGGFLVATGIAFITGSFTTLGTWLLDLFPALGKLG
ncbi:MAG TPA: cytochrome c biogenesis CcdA family protein, partial [Beijerinckiaceae bacterium]|nr:cytochrome c biogenesis CcdA family protein [Beijerinckiaceae bacterium]